MWIDKILLNDYTDYQTGGSLLSELREYFKIRVPERVLKCQEGLSEHNMTSLPGHMHAMKNSFLNVGALCPAERCQEIEDALPKMTLIEIQHSLNDLIELHAAVLSELETLIKNQPQISSTDQ